MLSPADVENRNADIARLTAELAGHHHPNFQGAIAVADGIRWAFTPFNGDEHMPKVPDTFWAAWTNSSISAEAKDFCVEEYKNAVDHWKQAHYARRAEAAVATADVAWTSLAQARTAMDQAFEALTSAEDNRWRSAVSRLLTTQEQALAAATGWDTAFGAIASLMADTVHLGWTAEDFQRFGVRPEWAIEADSDYYRLARAKRPAHIEVNTAIERQHDHIRAVAELLGDHTPTA